MMKRIIMIFAALMMCGSISAQGIMQVVYAESDDGFVNIRKSPSANASKVGEVSEVLFGLGSAIKIGEQGKWVKVSKGYTVGWCNGNYLGYQDWYTGYGSKILVAKKANTPIYCEEYVNENVSRAKVFGRVPKGTIIADEFTDGGDGNYYLITAGDGLSVRKSDVTVRYR